MRGNEKKRADRVCARADDGCNILPFGICDSTSRDKGSDNVDKILYREIVRKRKKSGERGEKEMLMQIEEIEEMREHGYTIEQISKIIGIGEVEVRKILGGRENDIRVC